MINLLGFLGSSLIVLSLTMKSLLRLRIVGSAGALVFICYGLWLGAWPVVATNCVTLSVHLFRLRTLITEPTSDDPVVASGPPIIIEPKISR
jgi:hypothetical protein